MKLVTYRLAGEERAGIVEGDAIVDAGTSVLDAHPGTRRTALAGAELLAPLVRPGKIICIGLNYRDHAAEAAMPIPEHPILFAKYANSIVGPGAEIRIPPITRRADYEAELGVVIGKTARRVPKERALEHVLGYTCLNDVSARDLQMASSQWTMGKALDTFCPIGPWIVTADEIPDPQRLAIACVVNGEKLQDASTADMLFSVADLIAYISSGITLEPGDLIATGTPPGVGFARKPPIYLKAGDEVRVEIERIGSLVNRVVADP